MNFIGTLKTPKLVDFHLFSYALHEYLVLNSDRYIGDDDELFFDLANEEFNKTEFHLATITKKEKKQ